MILQGVALLGKIQSRCDGVGSGVNGGKPSVNRALRGTLRGFCFWGRVYCGETLGSLKTAFDTALGLRRVGPDPDDAQLRQRPSDLGGRQWLAFVAGQFLEVPGDLGRGLKQSRLVGVEAERTSMQFHLVLLCYK